MTENEETKFVRIDHRHLAFFFLGAVAICAVFFALGFVVGRAQAFEIASKGTDTAKNAKLAAPDHSANSLEGTAEASESGGSPASSADYRKELDFYSALKEQKVEQNFHPQSTRFEKVRAPERSKTHIASGRDPAVSAPESGGGTLVSLQVAALRSSAEADKLVKTLRSKGYPVFVVNPSKEDPARLIRVQIGPYASETEAAKVKARLGSEGYVAITKK
jgi:cell division septation protein DedD